MDRIPVEDPPVVIIPADGEWQGDRAEKFCGLGFGEDHVAYYLPASIPAEIQGVYHEMEAEMAAEFHFVARTDETVLLHDAIPRLGIDPDADVHLLNFYSPTDWRFAVGWPNLKSAIDNGRVRQHNGVSGRVDCGRKVLLKDLCGLAGKQSFDEFTDAMGLHNPYKHLLDDCKGEMSKAMVERPRDYARYCVTDVRLTGKSYKALVANVRQIQRDLGMPDDLLWTEDDMPMRMGSLVARTLARWIPEQSGNPKLFDYCIKQLGILDPAAEHHDRAVEAMHDLRDIYPHAADLVRDMESDQCSLELGTFLEARFHETAMNACGSASWAMRSLNDSAIMNALVQGGRCANERPDECEIEDLADIDIRGCYGEALEGLMFPVGIPQVWSFTPNQRQTPTLGQLLKAHEGDLKPGLWTMTVSGRLPFEQDLIHSKYVDRKHISKAARSNKDPDKIPSDFVLARREITNGIVTHDVLKVLRKCTSDQEWAAILDLKVVTAVAYLKSNECLQWEDWFEAVVSRPGECQITRKCYNDTRSQAWYGIPLKGFVGKLVRMRNDWKAVKERHTKGTDGWNRAEGMQQTLKLMINIVYGVLASQFFDIGSTCLANNVTSRARVGVWQLAKALGLRQSITDGGIYLPWAVPSFEGKKPGLATLARMWDWVSPIGSGKDNRGRSVRLLPEYVRGVTTKKELDELALAHVKEFWAKYDLEFTFDIEHKGVFHRASYLGKGDYALLPYGESPEVLFKARGKDKIVQEGEKLHPRLRLLETLVRGGDEFPADLKYKNRRFMTIRNYKRVQDSGGYKKHKKLRPGDVYYVGGTEQYNNTHIPIMDRRDYLSKKNRRRVHRGKPFPWFEYHAPKGIRTVIRCMFLNQIR